MQQANCLSPQPFLASTPPAPPEQPQRKWNGTCWTTYTGTKRDIRVTSECDIGVTLEQVEWQSLDNLHRHNV